MATHGVMIPSKVASKNVESLIRSFKHDTDLDNGNLILLDVGISAVSGESEVFTAATPISAAPTGIWMVGEPEIVLTNSQYKGLDPDPRNFYVASGTVGTAFKIKTYDRVKLTADNFTNIRTTEQYANITASSVKLAWAATSTSATAFKLVEVTTIPLSSGVPGSNRIVAYRLEAISE